MAAVCTAVGFSGRVILHSTHAVAPLTCSSLRWREAQSTSASASRPPQHGKPAPSRHPAHASPLRPAAAGGLLPRQRAVRRGVGRRRAVKPQASNRNDVGRTRLSDMVLDLPERLDLYFNAKKHRKPLWSFILALFGFYSGNNVNLALGTLGVNDLAAAAVVTAVYEFVMDRFWTNYHQGPIPLYWVFSKTFIIGFVFAFIMDSSKLGG